MTNRFYPGKTLAMNYADVSLAKSNNVILEQSLRCIAFDAYRRIASGELIEVARKVKERMDQGAQGPIVILDEDTSRPIEVDFRGSADEVVERIRKTESKEVANGELPAEKRGIGRPKLGVVAREVTLLPRHWEWLNRQPGGASVALRKLVEEARRSHKEKDQARESQESVYRFLSSVAGDLPGFEESLRAFYAHDYGRFDGMIESWPEDVRDHTRKLAAAAVRDELASREKEKSS